MIKAESKRDKEIREGLINSKNSLFDSSDYTRLREVLYKVKPRLVSAYILSWTPEQGEDIYLLITDDHTIIRIELDRLQDDIDPLIETLNIKEFKSKISGRMLLRFRIAMDLLKNET